MANNQALNARQLAVKICMAVLTQGQSLSLQLDKQLKNIQSKRDQALCSELCYGFCRYYFVLTAQLKPLLNKPLKLKDQDIQVILLLGLYQIRFMRTDDHAAVNETVNLVNFRKKKWAKGLVNAILRKYLRQLDERNLDDVSELSDEEHKTAYPEWIIKLFEDDWKQRAPAVFKAGNQSPPMVLRINTHVKSREQYHELLKNNAIEATLHSVVSSALTLDKALSVDQIPGFEEGWVSVQDAAAQLAAQLLDCQPRQRVLDACAAPGGKTLHILQSENNLDLLALDKDQQRLHRVEQNLQRANVDAKLICADAAQTEDWFDGELFDRILLDAPCSATGIIRRHPDIRLLRQQKDIQQMVLQQKKLLDAMWPLLKIGGRLLYATCSVLRMENELQVKDFLSRQPDCVELPINSVQWGIDSLCGRQVLAGFDDMDGFYYALLEKTG